MKKGKLLLIGVVAFVVILAAFVMIWVLPGSGAANTPATSGGSDTQPATTSSDLPLANWGDGADGRSVYTQAEVAEGLLGEVPVLNSLSDSIIGDSRCFMYGQRVEADGTFGPLSRNFAVQPGETYMVYAYVQNDNPGTVANGVRTAISVPMTSTDCMCELVGVIQTEDAVPSEIWSTFVLVSEKDFRIAYTYGSAKLINSAYPDGLALEDAVVTKASSEGGVMIGYERLNGLLPGGEGYRAIVSIMIEIVEAPEATDAADPDDPVNLADPADLAGA